VSAWSRSRRRGRPPVFALLALLAACAGAPSRPSPPAIGAGDSRAAVEQRLGPPLGEWDTRQGVHYCRYVFRAGTAPGGPPAKWAYDKLIVAYDGAGRVISAFYGLSLLERVPDDGRRPDPRPPLSR